MRTRLADRLEKELAVLDRELKIELPKAIKVAVAMGDLRENADYQAALERQNFVRLRCGQIRKKLGELALIRIDTIPTDRVGFGSHVLLLDVDLDKQVRYELVLPDDGDVAEGRISVASPIGRGLIGHRVGDEVTIRTPSGDRMYEILEVKTLHELPEQDETEGAGPNPEAGSPDPDADR